MQKTNSEEKTIKRPWQASVLIYLIIISFLFTTLLQLWGDNNCGGKGEYIFLCNITANLVKYFISILPLTLLFYLIVDFIPYFIYNDLVFTIIFIFIFILNVFLIKNLLKGKKLLINIFFVYYFIDLFFVIVFFSLFMREYFHCTEYCADFGDIIFWILGLVTISFRTYLFFVCLKHPFYNQKKVEQKS